jgi:hypothetical protein
MDEIHGAISLRSPERLLQSLTGVLIANVMQLPVFCPLTDPRLAVQRQPNLGRK